MTRTWTVPGVAGAIAMIAGAALYLFEEQHTGKLQVVLIPAVVLLAFGAVLSYLGQREHERALG
ncbi:MAG: hypothetical protein WKG01_03785 [Kofleriaceae bacterium]